MQNQQHQRKWRKRHENNGGVNSNGAQAGVMAWRKMKRREIENIENSGAHIASGTNRNAQRRQQHKRLRLHVALARAAPGALQRHRATPALPRGDKRPRAVAEIFCTRAAISGGSIRRSIDIGRACANGAQRAAKRSRAATSRGAARRKHQASAAAA